METPGETIWRGRYRNCDKGYLVILPLGVVGHASLPPSPNHWFLISATNSSVTSEVTVKDPRVIDVYDAFDASDFGSARAYVQEDELKPSEGSEKITVLEESDTRFRRWPAVHVHFRKTIKTSTSEIEELVIYRDQKEIGPIFNVVMLRTTPEYYSHDRALYLQVLDGLHFIPVPKGQCSND
jgi:hypothetical protein